MTYDESLFSKIPKSKEGITMKLGGKATYLMRRVDFISFQMPSGGVLELNDILLFRV